jgi:hypothetical protein
MFCAPGVVFNSTEGAWSSFHDLRSQIDFGQYRERWVSFHILPSRTHFRRFRVRRVQFSSFALLNSLLTVPRASGPILMFCTSGLILAGTEVVGSRFHVLLSETRFERYRGHLVKF